jgi:hypothetical protein
MTRLPAATRLIAVTAIALCAPAWAASQTPSPSPAPGEIKTGRPPFIPPSTKPGPIAVSRPSAIGTDSADAGRWKGARASKTAAGQADVRLSDGASLHLRPGDVVGPDTVERIEAGRIVLARRAADSGNAGPKLATVVVSFDDSGLGHTRVYWLQDSKAIAPPIVK